VAVERRVKLMSDYVAGWPLWTVEEGLIAPGAFSLSASLTADLRDWQELFEREFHWDRGWRTPEAEAHYARAAPGLLLRLNQELGPDVHVTVDTWPVSDTQLVAWLGHHAGSAPGT
jgi:hypothetical protein